MLVMRTTTRENDTRSASATSKKISSLLPILKLVVTSRAWLSQAYWTHEFFSCFFHIGSVGREGDQWRKMANFSHDQTQILYKIFRYWLSSCFTRGIVLHYNQ